MRSKRYEPLFPTPWESPYGRLRSHDVVPVYDEQHARRRHTEVDFIINQRVHQLVEIEGNRLYRGSKLRLAGLRPLPSGVELLLGPTDYLEYLISNHNQAVNSELIARGIRLHSDPDAFLSNALGNLAVVRTRDDKIPLLLRSRAVATFSGYYDLPGGHPEPGHVSPSLASTEGLVRELFESIVRETSAELNLPGSSITEITAIGFVRSLEDGRKPEMIFNIITPMSSREVKDNYKRDGGEQYESDDLVFVDAREPALQELRMTAPTLAALERYVSLNR